MPLAGAFFVVMLQLTLVNEGWPLRRLGRIASGPIAVVAAWAIALTLYLLLVRTHPKPGSGLYFRGGGPLSGAEFGAILTAIGLWQVWFYVALRGWPFAQVTLPRRPTLARESDRDRGRSGDVRHLAQRHRAHPAEGQRSRRGGAHGRAVAGMLFEGLPPAGDNPPAGVSSCSARSRSSPSALYAALTAIAHQARWTTATPEEWVTYAGLNAIGLGVILHVGIGRRWPFAVAPAAGR